MPRVLDDFGTGYQHTTVIQTPDDEFVWIRRPGPDRPAPMTAAGPAITAAVKDIGGPVLPLLPEPGAVPGQAWRVFRATGPVSLARSFIHPESDTSDKAETVLAGTAETLTRLHSISVPERARLLPPSGPKRLLRWLGSGQGPRAARRLHAEAVTLLGATRIRRVQEWCAEVCDGGARSGAEDSVLLHGALSNGALIPSAAGRRDASPVLLIGEELAFGPREFDLGWLVGELVEYRDLIKYKVSPRPEGIDYQNLIDTFLGGYGSDLDWERLGRSSVLRVFVHTHDFGSYVGWAEGLSSYLRAVADMVDAAEHDTLLRRAAAVGR